MVFRRFVSPAVLAFVALEATPSSAQVPLVVGSVGYEAPGLVVPAVFIVRTTRYGANRWTVGSIGANLMAEWEHVASPRLSTVMRADLVWINANMSNFIYSGGNRDGAREYTGQNARLTATVRFRSSKRWTAELRAVGLHEFVGRLADTAVSALWDAPYAGVGVAIGYRQVLSDNVLQSRWDGLKASTEATAFIGSETWFKSQTWVGAGVHAGPVFFRGSGWLLLGRNLNIVSQHLVGGSWDLPTRPMVYGYHFAEFRVDRAVVANGGIDIRLGGAWEIGMRAGYLTSPSETTFGQAIRLSSVWQGIAFYGGLGFPEGVISDALAFVWLSAALVP